MVHLATADLLVQNGDLSPRDLPAYYLGSIAPDAIHMRENPAKDAKQISHLHARNPENIGRIAAFLKDFPRYEAEGVSHDYLLGYAVHLLTDVYWELGFSAGFRQRYAADPQPVQDCFAAYYNDTDVADISLYNTLPRREVLWELLKKARGYDLPGLVSGEEADKWNARTLGWYDVPRSYLPVRYATEQTVRDYIQLAAGLIRDYLKENGVC